MKPELGAAETQGFMEGPGAGPIERLSGDELELMDAMLEAYLHFVKKKNISYSA